MPRSGLPIDDVLTELSAALAHHLSAVLQAPPGAGKSTVVPLALLSESWMSNKRLIMLEPRRLAARAVAQRMAQTLGEPIGRTVGYRMRMDTRVSADTRIEVVTEGVLARMLQTDPALEGVAAVLFDEFHERSLQADLGLALALDARANLSPDLRVLVMSATLDGEAVARLLGNAPIVTAQGRSYPVESRYLGKGAPMLPGALPAGVPYDAAERAIAQLVRRALNEEAGDILVFLPGVREIHRVRALLEADGVHSNVSVLPLFGDLSPAEQDAALAPSKAGARKIVLATNVAETSLTLPGIRVVVDSGLARRSLFDPSTGMSRLEIQRISRASADQRQGRAGRLEAGVCYRAWSEGGHRSLAPFTPPEIVDADLVPLALELAAWGIREVTDLSWLDPPPAATLASARDLLQRLGALDAEHRITEHGREMARLGTHPRLAHMLLRARALGATSLVAQLSALLSERDLLRGPAGTRDADIRTRLEHLRSETESRHARGALQRARRAASDLERLLSQSGSSRTPGQAWDVAHSGIFLAFAYPDRIARRRSGADGRYMLANGRGAYFAEPQTLSRQEFIVAVDLDDQERDAKILLAAPIDREDIATHFAERIRRETSVAWSDRDAAVIARHVVRLDSLILEEKPASAVSAESTRAAMLEGIRKLGLAALPWSQDAKDLQARIEFMRCLDDTWPDVSDAVLERTLDAWLAPFLSGITRRDHLARLSLVAALKALLPWDRQRKLDELAPTHLTVPSGSRIRIDYRDESAPAVSVRLQEVFGLESSPLLGGGRVPVTFKLLSPAQRPVQVTRDLASFWRGSYADVRKDMRGRYPKHYWPSLQELENDRKKED